MITQEYVQSILQYDPETGDWVWLKDMSYRTLKGSIAGHRNEVKGSQTCYWSIKIDGKDVKAHRLAFLYMTGSMPERVDHRDTNGLNNRWDNLRIATQTQNQGNRKKNRNNTTGFKGVFKTRRPDRWEAAITVKGKKRNLGYFDTKEEAAAAYEKAAIELFGEFARV